MTKQWLLRLITYIHIVDRGFIIWSRDKLAPNLPKSIPVPASDGSRTYARRHFARVAFARRQKPAGHIPVVAEYPSTKCPSMTKARQFLARWILCPLVICPFLFSYSW